LAESSLCPPATDPAPLARRRVRSQQTFGEGGRRINGEGEASLMNSDGEIPEGTKRIIEGQWRVFHDRYWIKAYEAPADTLTTKKRLIEALTRRLFNHVEHGLNIPGVRLEEARRAFELEAEPQKKRVKGAMLAGALFNRATEVFTKVVEIQALGVAIQPDNELMGQCGEYLQEALVLGQMVLHRSGDEGIDELWGEPFKAFAFPIEDFYRSRYIKIAQTMRAIDTIADGLVRTFDDLPMFAGIAPLVADLSQAGRAKCETLHTDPEIFDVWASFVTAAERLSGFQPALPPAPTLSDEHHAWQGLQLIHSGKDLISYITRARVPMPRSTREWLERCAHYRSSFPIESPPPAPAERPASRPAAAPFLHDAPAPAGH
jgi:hypothetical protein